MNILRRILLSIFPGERETPQSQSGQRKYFQNFLLHFRPRVVPERTLRFSFTWGLGDMATVLVLLLFGSGLLLKFFYEPFPDRAYDSILFLNNQIPFGRLLRNIHRWSANGLLFVVFLHFLRVFYTSAFLAPRQTNWIIGLMLFAAVVLSNFTGYLLPWDQTAYWAITISTSMLDYIPGIGTGLKEWVLGGAEPGGVTLLSFYAIHTAVLPALLLFLLLYHFWRIRKANGLVIPRTPDEDPAPVGPWVETMPHLIVREVATALIVLAVILAISMSIDAPLGDPANPGLSPNPTKAPWYFMGIQEMLMHFHPVFAVWFCSNKGRKMALIAAVVAVFATIAGVLLDEFVLGVNVTGPTNIISNGLLPFAIVLAACGGSYFLMKKHFKASNNEAIQSLFTLLTTSFVVLTLIGIWFRGAGMQLMWAG